MFHKCSIGRTYMATAPNPYGPHTEQKLQAISAYLDRFLTVMSGKSGQHFETMYVDAFAGSGTMPIGLGGEILPDMLDAERIVAGSALRAVQLRLKFDRYVFIEIKCCQAQRIAGTTFAAQFLDRQAAAHQGRCGS
jgi:three-Cys-motif partner protein